MKSALQCIAAAGVFLTGIGLANAQDITATPFIQDGKLAFAITNHNKTQAIMVDDLQLVAQKDLAGPCPANIISQGSVTVPAEGQGTLKTALEPSQLAGCLTSGWKRNYTLADIVRISDNPNEVIPLKHPGVADTLITGFPYTFKFSGPGWQSSTMTSGYVYFRKEGAL